MLMPLTNLTKKRLGLIIAVVADVLEALVSGGAFHCELKKVLQESDTADVETEHVHAENHVEIFVGEGQR
jgi:hypothetical protein